ncbi:MAG: hypothetical protein AB2669_08335 [Candidatus Thiodiazotropha endolucinida]
MPTFPGARLPGISQQEPPSWPRSTEISERTVVAFPFEPDASSIAQPGSKQDTQPVAEQPLTLSGHQWPAFGRDWYHRIHIIPSTIDLGNLISSVERVLEVWNARFDNQTLNAIDETATDGLLLSGQPAPPLNFGPLQSRRYTFAAGTRGAPVIDARYRFSFASGVTSQLLVTGRRVVVFGMRPEWSQGMTERLAWLTEVLESYDGTEQRVRLRQLPRRFFEYRFLIADKDARVLDHLLFAWGARIYCLPVWMDVTVLTEAISAGSDTVTVDDAMNSDYHAGGLAVLWQSNTRHEAVEILSITGNTLTLKLSLSTHWPAGTRVFPARLTRLEGDVTVTRPTDTIAMGRCRFSVEDLTSDNGVDVGDDYQGYTVFDWPPDRSEDIEDRWRRKLALIDYETGLPTVDDESGSPKIGRQLTWLLKNRVDISRYRGWLAARAGRANPCWLPTFESDLQVLETVAATDAGITVENVGYARFVNADTQRRDLLLRTTAGTFYRRITGAHEISDEQEQLSLDAPLGVSLQPEQFLQMAYLELARLDQDSVELHWETNTLARIQVTTRTLRS